MRIKLFETFKEDYYVKITEEEFNTLHSDDNKDGFSPNEIDYIENLNFEVKSWGGQYKSSVHMYHSRPWTLEPIKNMSCYITKLEDRYFIVCTLNIGLNSFYKCDQWEGLLKLLKDKNII
jgi:hypothetical protein